jgi:hypothetical protein
MNDPGLSPLLERLERIEAMLVVLVERQQRDKEWYTTKEVADILGRSEYTVREWCRLRRVKAMKKASGRGMYQDWIISQEELQRIQKEGLLPFSKADD